MLWSRVLKLLAPGESKVQYSIFFTKYVKEKYNLAHEIINLIIVLVLSHQLNILYSYAIEIKIKQLYFKQCISCDAKYIMAKVTVTHVSLHFWWEEGRLLIVLVWLCKPKMSLSKMMMNRQLQDFIMYYNFFFFFFMESTENAICLICKEQIATVKEYDVKRHSLTKHREQYEKYQGGESKQRTKHLLRGL